MFRRLLLTQQRLLEGPQRLKRVGGFALGLSSVTVLGLHQRNLRCEEKVIFPPLIKREPLPQHKASDAEKWGILINLMSQDKLYYVVAAICSVFGSLATSAQGKVIGTLFDSMGSSVSLREPLQQLLLLMFGQASLAFLNSFVLAAASTEFGRRLREMFYRAILFQDVEKFDSSRTGEITHQLSQDIGGLQTAVRSAFSRGVEGITSIISGSIYLYMASPKMAICMFTILPVMSMTAHLLGVLLRSLSARIRKVENRATGIANETIAAIRTVRSFGASEREIDRYSSELKEVARLKNIMAFTAGGFYSMLGLGINLITLLICGYGGHLVSSGELTRGGIAAVVTQVQILERSMARLSMVSAQLIKAFRASEHIFDKITEEPLVNTSKGGLGLCLLPRTTTGQVTFDHVHFRYPSRPDIMVLKDFSLHIKPGETVALVGNSGGGKSTLAALIERFYDVEQGSVTIDEVNVKDMEPDCLHHIVGIVSQEPILFGTSILENIRYGKPHATNDQVIQAAQSANAHGFISKFPDGYSTELGERGVLLSGGQKQRIAIARAILSDPRVLILDEATSALDAESEFLVQQALATLMSGRTTLIIAHRLTTIKGADTICVLDQGSIVEKGSHEELIKKPDGQYRALFKRQQN